MLKNYLSNVYALRVGKEIFHSASLSESQTKPFVSDFSHSDQRVLYVRTEFCALLKNPDVLLSI